MSEAVVHFEEKKRGRPKKIKIKIGVNIKDE